VRIAVYGSGFVGLVTGVCFADQGHDVVCIDPNRQRLDTIGRGVPPFFEPGLETLLKSTLASGRLSATDDPASSIGAQVIFVAVGTPTHDGRIDLGQISAAAETIGKQIADTDEFTVVVVKSTVVPGTTSGPVTEILERVSGKVAGRDFGVCMNPEFLREGSAVDDFRDPDRIVIGTDDERTAAIMSELYAPYDCPKFVTTPSNAEMSKYVSNCLLATLISFSNEFANLCQATPGTDIELVMDALAQDRRLSPRVGGEIISPGILTYLRPGIGYGGSCLPKDVAALRHMARNANAPMRMLDTVHEINETRAADAIAVAESIAGSLSGRKVAVLGLAFKPGTDDLRESPGLRVIDHLVTRGAQVSAFDPLVKELASHDSISIADSAMAALEGARTAIIATAWPEFRAIDWAAAVSEMDCPVVVDGRNILATVTRPSGMIYVPIGKPLAAPQ
jgi:UDPglucose 6-dehydrogenase/GDP-mannose 6-dehydrogenase